LFVVDHSMITIRNFEDAYLHDLYRISLATGHLGGDASHLYADPKLMGHIYSAPYARLEPSLVLIAMDDHGVAGFALGVVDTATWEDRLEREWWPTLRVEYQDPSRLPESGWTPDQRRAHMIHHPTRAPSEVAMSYPAHLHLNLLPRLQGAGVGSRLLAAWLDLVARRSPPAVHVGVNRHNERAMRFWARAGFSALEPQTSEPSRTIWLGRRLASSHGASGELDRGPHL
jgi:GNAT superfamily N-acetyltransferase